MITCALYDTATLNFTFQKVGRDAQSAVTSVSLSILVRRDAMWVVIDVPLCISNGRDWPWQLSLFTSQKVGGLLEWP